MALASCSHIMSVVVVDVVRLVLRRVLSPTIEGLLLAGGPSSEEVRGTGRQGRKRSLNSPRATPSPSE